MDRFVPVVQKSFSSFGKTSCFPLAHFFLFLGASCTSSLSSLSPFSVPSSPFISLHVLPCSPSICLPLNLSDPVSTRLSMASALCFSPPVVFNLCSPRMHLFKSCFTNTVLKRMENGLMMTVFTCCKGAGGETSKLMQFSFVCKMDVWI